MRKFNDSLRNSVINYCSKIGNDPLLVQGPGGNVSWKEGGTLWVKASGTWLADANKKDIFVDVDLNHLKAAIHKGDYSVKPKLIGDSKLSPSIETLLHALMPHQIVIHLHAIEILAHLVQVVWQDYFQSLVLKNQNWASVEYKKPGADLAAAVEMIINKSKNINVIFLQNHGVVIGGSEIAEVDEMLIKIIDIFKIPENKYLFSYEEKYPIIINKDIIYYPISDRQIHLLAIDEFLFSLLKSNWALYPDHVVFLGPFAYIYFDEIMLQSELNNTENIPELIFIQGKGVFVKSGFNSGKMAQLRCYYDILVRQNNKKLLNSLSTSHIDDLLSWDAEKYRINISK